MINFGISEDRIKRIFGLALPIIAGMVSQNVLNLVDTAMVGRLGAEALAATGISSMVAFLYISPFLGITSGVQAIAARKKGEGKLNEAACPLNTSFIYSIFFSVLIIAAAFWLVDPLFNLLSDSETIRPLAKDYFLIRVCACFFVMVNYSFRGFWNAIDKAKIYMNTLIVMHITNIVLNYLLIFGKFGFPRLEVQGAALATAISLAVGTLVYFIAAFHSARENGFFCRVPEFQQLIKLMKISFPAGFEFFITMSSIVVLYWMVGKIGISELAAINILMNIFLVTLLPALGFGISLATLSGQALGAKDPEGAYLWGIDIAKLSLGIFVLLALPMFLFPAQILNVFTSDMSVISVSESALRIMGLTLGLEMMGFVYLEALKGIGYSKVPTMVSFVNQWLFFLPLVWILIFKFHMGLFEIWMVQILSHILMSLIFTKLWNDKKWQNLSL